MSLKRFGSNRAKLILSGVGAASLIAVLCAQWIIAESQRQQRTPREPAGVADLSPPAPGAGPSPPPAPKTAEARAPTGQPGDLARLSQPGGLPRAPDGPSGESLGLIPTAPVKPNVDQTAGLRTGPPDGSRPDRRESPGDTRPFTGREERERALSRSEAPPAPPGVESPLVTGSADGASPPRAQGSPSRPPSAERPAEAGRALAASGRDAARPSPSAAGQPATFGRRDEPVPPPGAGPAAGPARAGETAPGPTGAAIDEPSRRGDLQAVVDQITRLRDEVRGVGDRVTKLREDVRADLSRLEGKIQALEPRRAAARGRRTQPETPAMPGGRETRESEPPSGPSAAIGTPGLERARPTGVAEPQGVAPGDRGRTASAAGALRRPPVRTPGRNRVTAASPRSTAGLAVAPAAGAGGLGRDRTAARPLAVRRRPASREQRLAAQERGFAAPAGADPDLRRRAPPAPRRPSDPRYASFRVMQPAPGAGFRMARRSLRYRPIIECVP